LAFKSTIRYSKISLVFGVDCNIFCEGVKGNAVVKQKPENTTVNCSILPFPVISTTLATAKPNVQVQVNVPLKQKICAPVQSNAAAALLAALTASALTT
jgi:hypothetical protein